jgi:hypothetical protein
MNELTIAANEAGRSSDRYADDTTGRSSYRSELIGMDLSQDPGTAKATTRRTPAATRPTALPA